MDRTAPSSVCRTTPLRASASAPSAISQPRICSTDSAGSSPFSSSGLSATVNSGESFSPRVVSMRARWLLTSATAPGGVRSSTIATAALRSAACFRKPQGTWSA